MHQKAKKRAKWKVKNPIPIFLANKIRLWSGFSILSYYRVNKLSSVRGEIKNDLWRRQVIELGMWAIERYKHYDVFPPFDYGMKVNSNRSVIRTAHFFNFAVF